MQVAPQLCKKIPISMCECAHIELHLSACAVIPHKQHNIFTDSR